MTKVICCSILLFLLFCSFSFRIIPVVTLNGKTEGRIDAQKFAKFSELQVNVSRGHNCDISLYTLFYIPYGESIQEYEGKTCTLSEPILNSIRHASKGDKYIFYGIMVQCDGDKEPIQVNHLNFNIK